MPSVVATPSIEIRAASGPEPRGLEMAQWHGISRRKSTGGRRRLVRGKRRTEISSEQQFALVGESRRKLYRKTGGMQRVRVLSEQTINVSNPAKGTTQTITMSTVIENPSNPNYVRRNILTKGAVVDTELG